ncbi:MAG: LLM class flavin-dependent oxidoreductase [Dehalococcoidia bacterium]
MDLELGAHLPLISFDGASRSLGDLIAFTEAARDLGYTHLCSNDHLVFARPWLDGPTALAAVASRSGEMTLATTVIVPALRGPVATAKMIATLDVLTEGRVLVAAGPGSSARDYELIGIPFEERWRRLEESVQALRACWSTEGAGFTGRYYSTHAARLEPLPAQAGGPPIWIGSWGSAPGLRRVARHADGWLASGYNTTPEQFAAAWRDVLSQVAAAGREAEGFPNGIATMWSYVTDDAERAERVLADLLAPMLNRPVEQLRGRLPIGGPEECAAVLSSYAAAGAQRVFLWPLMDERAQLQAFRERVMPLVADAA